MGLAYRIKKAQIDPAGRLIISAELLELEVPDVVLYERVLDLDADTSEDYVNQTLSEWARKIAHGTALAEALVSSDLQVGELVSVDNTDTFVKPSPKG